MTIWQAENLFVSSCEQEKSIKIVEHSQNNIALLYKT